MADEKQNEGTAVPGEVTPLIQEAMEQGWVPKDQYEGDPERWVDAGEFVRRGELFRKIESQSKEIKSVHKALVELGRHNAKIAEVEYQRALSTLRAEKKQALVEGDYDKVEQIEEQIDLTKEQQRVAQTQAVQAAIPQEVHPELKNWISQNPWYESNSEMRDYADFVGQRLAGTGSPTEVLKEVTKRVKEQFKDKFKNPNRERAAAVEGSRGTPASAKSEKFELNETERSVMQTLVRQKVMTEEQYIEQLKAIKENK
jgi:hypothetical protein